MLSNNSHSPSKILQLAAEETYLIRQQILRPGRPANECMFEGDTEKSTLHLGVFIAEKLVGVASYMKNNNTLFTTPVQFQLRGMAILPEYRQQKLGEALLLAGEKILKKDHHSLLLWFNARETAVDFYRKYGYKTKGDLFMVPNVCKHIVMLKEFS